MPRIDPSGAAVRALYVGLFEVRPGRDCELDPREYAGAFVRCFVFADALERALDDMKCALGEANFDVADVLWIFRSGEVEWDNTEDPDGIAAADEAARSGEVVFSSFEGWPPELARRASCVFASTQKLRVPCAPSRRVVQGMTH